MYKPCSCESPGYCERHLMEKSRLEWLKCLKSDYCRMTLDREALCSLTFSKKMITISDLTRMTIELIPRIVNPKAIIGIPRSGLIPASIISTLTHSPLYTIDQKTLSIQSVGSGTRFNELDGEIIYLVDDSSYSGRTIAKTKEAVKEKFSCEIKTVTIFSSEISFDKIDIYHSCYDKHYFDWNIYNTHAKCAFDLDGVLCRDFTQNEDDDGPVYADVMQNMIVSNIQPKRYPVTIVTARLEKYRRITEKWLLSNGFRINQLHMGPWNNKSERDRVDIGLWKSSIVKGLEEKIFVESDSDIAKTIKENTKKTVICNTTGDVYQ